MRTEITINGSSTANNNYITWSPVPCQIRLTDTDGAAAPVLVRLRNNSTNRGGQIIFFSALSGTGQDTLDLTLPIDRTSVNFFIAGKFGNPSTADKDAVIEAIEPSSGSILSTTLLMVRIRKNANNLTADERNRFISALSTLNDRGRGRYSDFRNIHTSAGDPEAHQNAGFLPWHRAFILDLERELQSIDASVALPYWRFDQPAPNIFNRDFMGVANRSTGTVSFSASNLLQFWFTDGIQGITRLPLFNPMTQAARNPSQPPPANETATIGTRGTPYATFRRMEGNPHGAAHTSFTGSLSQIPTAVRDPLFFLLHTNVDRLWAKWQWFNRRFDITSVDTYTFLGSASSPGATRIGHNLKDTMWPWNQIIGTPRPPTAPGGNFPVSALISAPSSTPTVGEMIDYHGVINLSNRIGFSYDDVPFEF
jgi:tyrosinase